MDIHLVKEKESTFIPLRGATVEVVSNDEKVFFTRGSYKASGKMQGYHGHRENREVLVTTERVVSEKIPVSFHWLTCDLPSSYRMAILRRLRKNY